MFYPRTDSTNQSGHWILLGRKEPCSNYKAFLTMSVLTIDGPSLTLTLDLFLDFCLLVCPVPLIYPLVLSCSTMEQTVSERVFLWRGPQLEAFKQKLNGHISCCFLTRRLLRSFPSQILWLLAGPGSQVLVYPILLFQPDTGTTNPRILGRKHTQ